jgi:dTDP-4-dehydrorhamnose 3,5-epimerase
MVFDHQRVSRSMNLTATTLPGVVILEPRVFEDPRGYFFESYSAQKLAELGIDTAFLQDNQSKSSYGVIRGLHYQLPPFAQCKLVRAVEGCILDVAVDLRKGSPTFRKWVGVELSAENKRQLLIPHGFAHGFSVLSPSAVVQYKCDAYYSPSSEGGIRFDEPSLGIDWKIPPEQAIVSEKDQQLPKWDMGNFHDQFHYSS